MNLFDFTKSLAVKGRSAEAQMADRLISNMSRRIAKAVGSSRFHSYGPLREKFSKHLQLHGMLHDAAALQDGQSLGIWIVDTGTLEDLNAESRTHLVSEWHASRAEGIILALPRSGTALQSWESILIEAGFRKHPLHVDIDAYVSSDRRHQPVVCIMERMDDDVASRHPLASLAEERGLHMDMTREAGRRSDAHLVRYALAARHIRPGDKVVDVACGYGYGSSLMARSSEAASVHGVDLSESSISYSKDNFGGPRVDFVVGDAQDLSRFSDNSVDLVASFETLEHIPHPERLISEANRILKPGGRIVASVPNRWVDENGNDPNPHHLHVYDRKRIEDEFGSTFLIDLVYGQTAGGNYLSHPKEPKGLHDLKALPDAPAEWIVIVAIKPLHLGRGMPYVESVHSSADASASRFSAGFENPYLAQGLLEVGWRPWSSDALDLRISKTLEISGKNAADIDAALCVKAYKALADEIDLTEISAMLEERLASIESQEGDLRWQVSLAFVLATIKKTTSNPLEAASAFDELSRVDVVPHHPSLATKTSSAGLSAARLHAALGDIESARSSLKRTVEIAGMASSDFGRRMTAEGEEPYDFYFKEIAETLLNGANACKALKSPDLETMKRAIAMFAKYADARTARSNKDMMIDAMILSKRYIPGKVMKAIRLVRRQAGRMAARM
jgi:SAM-dependent methyltransferase